MAIKIYSDRIELGDKVITATPLGIRIDNSLSANTQNLNASSTTNFTAKEFRTPADIAQASYAGLITGYISGGYSYSPFNGVVNTITKFSLVSGHSGSAYSGVTLSPTWSGAGVSSRTHGYIAGGSSTNVIQKFSFTSEGNATDVGDLIEVIRSQPGGHADLQRGFGYRSKGYSDSPSPVNPDAAQSNAIDKWPFASDTNATDVGDATASDWAQLSWSSLTHGIMASNNVSNSIDRFPFASDTNATDVGDVSPTFGNFGSSTQSSTTAYAGGGGGGGFFKFPFATALSAVTATTTTTTVITPAPTFRSDQHNGVSSPEFGFHCGGAGAPSPTYPNNRRQVDRFPFATEVISYGVGDLGRDARLNNSQQY